jgi:SAM-dependent methyltransferase
MIDLTGLVSNVHQRNGIWFCDERIDVSYPKNGNEKYFTIEDKSYWYTHRNRCILACVNQYARENALFADIGSGNGFVSMALKNNGLEMLPIEPDFTGTINARKRGLENLLCASFESVPFAAGSLPFAGMFDVLEHIQKQEPFLKKVHSTLERNGLLFITVPAYRFLWSAEDIHDGHYRRYTRKSLNHLLTRAGFSTIYSTYFFSFLPLPVFLLRRLPYVLGLPRKQTSETYARENAIVHPILAKAARWIFQGEMKKIERGKSILFGGSILAVARKSDSEQLLSD